MKRFFNLVITTGLLAVASQAAIVITAEAPGVQNTTQAGTYLTETFDESGVPAPGNPFPGGSYVSPIGSYSGGSVVVAPNAYGGANQTNYISIGAQQPSDLSYTLTFADTVYYFGFYWPAGDGGNRIDFLDGANVVGSYRVSDVVAALGLGSAYNGNPNTGENTGEKYVFLNFTATDTTQFTAVRFANDSNGTGFETDNHTISFERVTPNETTPEPATFGLAGAALLALGFKVRRKR